MTKKKTNVNTIDDTIVNNIDKANKPVEITKEQYEGVIKQLQQEVQYWKQVAKNAL